MPGGGEGAKPKATKQKYFKLKNILVVLFFSNILTRPEFLFFRGGKSPHIYDAYVLTLDYAKPFLLLC